MEKASELLEKVAPKSRPALHAITSEHIVSARRKGPARPQANDRSGDPGDLRLAACACGEAGEVSDQGQNPDAMPI